MIYVYGVMAAPAPVSDLVGVEDALVEATEVDGLTLALSRLGDDGPAPSDAAVLRHAEVVEALARTGAAVLPARFGLAFADDAALAEGVRERRAALEAALAHVEGCVELGLRVLAPEQGDAAAGATGGGDYLRARLRETEARERLAAELHDALAARSRDAQRAAAADRWLLSSAYLVPVAEVDGFRRAFESLEASHPELELLLTGPWPPYSFAPTEAGAT